MNVEAQRTVNPEAFSGAILGRVESLTLILGSLGIALAAWRWGWRGAVGLAVGVTLSWINFRWLKGSVKSFGRVAAQTGPESEQIPPAVAQPPRVGPSASPVRVGPSASPARVGKAAYFKFIGRYVLLLGGVYVILTRTSLPAVSVLAGLFASAAAVVAGIFYELLLSAVRQTFGTGS